MAPKSAGKPAGKPAATPTGRRPSGKLEPEAGATSAVVLSRGVKIFWIIIVILTLVSLVAFILMFLKYREAKAKKFPYDEPFQNLKRRLAISLNRPDLEQSSDSDAASAVENLPNTIIETDKDFEAKKKKYRDLLHKAMRSSSGPWKLHGRSLYYFSKEEKTWYDAENFCISRDAHLTSVLNEEEQNFIRSQLAHTSWIGLTLENEEGKWKWSDGSTLVKLYWSDDKTNTAEAFGESSQDCTLMVPSLTAHNWHDESCHKRYRWVCKENLDHVEP